MKPQWRRLIESIPQWSQWTYKDKTYQVMTVTTHLLSQDPDGEWAPTVIYTLVNDRAETRQVNAMQYRFARAITEFTNKFQRVES